MPNTYNRNCVHFELCVSEDLNDTLLITWINTCFPVILIITPYTF